MKPVFISFCALVFFACSGEQDPSIDATTAEGGEADSTYCDCRTLVFSEPYNHFYHEDSEEREGYSGKCDEFYPGGEHKLEKNFVEGKLHGKYSSWYENGQVREEMEFDMNFQEGESIRYTDRGEVKFHALYKRGTQTKVLVNRPDLPDTDEWAPAN